MIKVVLFLSSLWPFPPQQGGWLRITSRQFPIMTGHAESGLLRLVHVGLMRLTGLIWSCFVSLLLRNFKTFSMFCVRYFGESKFPEKSVAGEQCTFCTTTCPCDASFTGPAVFATIVQLNAWFSCLVAPFLLRFTGHILLSQRPTLLQWLCKLSMFPGAATRLSFDVS